jgi:hypothetical protein
VILRSRSLAQLPEEKKKEKKKKKEEEEEEEKKRREELLWSFLILTPLSETGNLW